MLQKIKACLSSTKSACNGNLIEQGITRIPASMNTLGHAGGSIHEITIWAYQRKK